MDILRQILQAWNFVSHCYFYHNFVQKSCAFSLQTLTTCETAKTRNGFDFCVWPLWTFAPFFLYLPDHFVWNKKLLFVCKPLSCNLLIDAIHVCPLQMLHDFDNSASPSPRWQSQGTCWYRQDWDRQGSWEGAGQLRHRGELLRGSGLQVYGAHVQWFGTGTVQYSYTT